MGTVANLSDGVGRLGLGSFVLRLRLRSEGFAEGIHGNRRVFDFDDLKVLRLSRRTQIHPVAGGRLHERIGDGRAPTDVPAVKIHLIDAHNRDDVFDAGGVFVRDGGAEENARSG